MITANGLLQRSGDTTYPFRQDSNFWYLTGIMEPDVTLVMDKTKEYLIVPGRAADRVTFDGTIDAKAIAKVSAIESVIDEKQGWERLAATIKKSKKTAVLQPGAGYMERHGFYTNPARKRLSSKLKSYNSKLEIQDIRPRIARLRMVKQEPELAAIQSAVDITLEAMSIIKKNLPSYKSEAEINADITAFFIKAGAVHAYEPIIAADKNACTLHYIANSHEILNDSMVLIDVGAEVSLYAADITRTLTVGNPSKRRRQVTDAVINVQKYAMGLIKPGLLMKDYEKQVEQYMGDKLIELGLIKTNDRSSVRRYYPHATSHFLGLDVHDAADYEVPFETNMVLTVEPGIYIPEEGIGVRMEDDVAIEENGIRVLSELLPKTLD
ncbi:aminopeptidase P family protein [soil metagenome]